MHWRRLREQAGDAVVLSMAYPLPKDDFLRGLAGAIAAETDMGRFAELDVEVGLDLGIAEARVRRSHKDVEIDLRASLRRLADSRGRDGRTVLILVDDIDLVVDPGDALLQLRASALELYANDVSFAYVVAGSPGLFGSVRAAHEPLIRFFEPLPLGPLDRDAAARAISDPLRESKVSFDPEVIAEIVQLSGGRPYYLQKLAYYTFDAAERGRVSQAAFAIAFERAFASVSQEIFAARWAAMAPTERQVAAAVAFVPDPRLSGEIESVALRRGIQPAATRQALRRLVLRGHVERLANGQRGRYFVRDRLFRRYLVLQAAGW
jgi:hypothetical protein